MSRHILAHKVLILCVILFWLMPGRLGLSGFPDYFIQLSDIVVLAVVFAILVFRDFSRMRLLSVIFLMLAATKLLLGILWQPTGISDAYYSNLHWQGSPEISWVTNTDTRVDFSATGFSPFEQSFRLHFFNDPNRFSQVDRKFSAQWGGQILILPQDYQQLSLSVAGGNASLTLDKDTYTLGAGETLTIPVTNGIHRFNLTYQCFDPHLRQLKLAWADTQQALPASRFLSSIEIYRYNRLLCLLNLLLHVVWLVMLGILYRNSCYTHPSKDQQFLYGLSALCVVIFVARAIAHGRGYDAAWEPPGSDGLIYEFQARAILAGEWLNAGEPALPFTMNVLYRYCLAGLHLLVGESLTMVILAQQLVMLGIVLLILKIIRQLFDKKISMIVIFQLIVFYLILFRFPKELLDTTFGIGFSFAGLYFLLGYARQPSQWHIMGAALFLILACLLRANLLPFLLVATCWIIWHGKSIAKQMSHTAIFLTIIVIPLLLVGLRNWYIADIFTIIPQTGLTNLWLGNRPPETIGDNFYTPAYILPQEQMLADVIQYFTSRPSDFLWGLIVKALYIFGIVLYIDDKTIFSITWYILLPWLLVLVGSYRYWRKRETAWRAELLLLWLWLAFNIAVLIAIFPWGYGWRLSGPMFPALYLMNALFWHDTISKKLNSQKG